MTPAPFDEHREIVHPEWIDENGHFNMGYYMVAFDRATDTKGKVTRQGLLRSRMHAGEILEQSQQLSDGH